MGKYHDAFSQDGSFRRPGVRDFEVPDAELEDLCRYTTCTLLPAMLRQVAGDHGEAIGACDQWCDRRPGDSTRWLTELATALEGAIGPNEVLGLLEEWTPKVFALHLSVHHVPGETDLADDHRAQLAHVALRDVYGTMWRARGALEGVHDLVEDDDYHNEPWQLAERLRHLAHVAAGGLGAGTAWGLCARLVADGVPAATATAAVTAVNA